MAPLAASLAIFDEVGMPALRSRSVALTGYLADRLDGLGVEVITPRDPAARGAQLSLRFESATRAEAVLAGLAARGVVADFRAPDSSASRRCRSTRRTTRRWAATERLREALG